MNVGIVTTWFERGASYVSRQYRDILEDGGNTVFIYARGEVLSQGDSVWDDNFVTWAQPTKGITAPHSFDLQDFKRWLLNSSIDLVLFNEQQWWPPVEVCKRLGVKAGIYIDYYTEETLPFFLLYDFVICNTQRHFELFKNHPNVLYVPWGTDLELYKPRNDFNPVNLENVTFFHSAGYSPHRKGTDILIQAATQIKGLFKLIIHTQVELEVAFPQLEAEISSLQESKKLEIVHRTVGAPGLYFLGDVYVYPSRLDGIGLTVAEALASGLPVIVTDSPPMSEFVSSRSGKLIEVERFFARADGYFWPQALANKHSLAIQMQFYIDNFSELVGFKKAAKLYADEFLNWKKNASFLNEALKTFLLRQDRSSLDENLIEKIAVYEKRRGWGVCQKQEFLVQKIKRKIKSYFFP